MSNKKDRSQIFFYLRLAVGIFLLLILLKIIDFRQMGLIFVSAQPYFIVMGLLAIILNFLLKTYRWASIVWIRAPDLSFRDLMRFNFISLFFAIFLPGSVLPDIVRIYQVSKQTSKLKSAISSIVLDRIIGNLSTAIITVVALIALEQTGLVQIGSSVSCGIFGFLILSLGVPLALQNSTLIAGMRRLSSRFGGIKLFARVRDTYDDLLLYQNEYWLILKALSISFLNLLIAVFEFYLIALAFSAEPSIGYYLIFVPLAIFLAMLPVSLGGVGILEVTMVFFFSKVGMSAEICLGIVLVRRALLLLFALPGGMFYILEGFPAKKLSV
jgi:glycosyltransferase 2 family protein